MANTFSHFESMTINDFIKLGFEPEDEDEKGNPIYYRMENRIVMISVKEPINNLFIIGFHSMFKTEFIQMEVKNIEEVKNAIAFFNSLDHPSIEIKPLYKK